MAPVLQCPECGARHPLDSVGLRSAFPCTGCGRTLKVPEQARTIAPVAPAVDPDATRVFSSTAPPLSRAAAAAPPGVAAAGRTPAGVATPGGEPIPGATTNGTGPGSSRLGPLGPVPGRWARFGMWVIAVPLAFLIVFGLAKAFGLLTTNEITDVALAEGWHRFVPIGRLVPVVALVTAALVHGGAYGIARLRARSAPGPKPDARSDTGRSKPTRQPSGASR